MCLGMLSRLHVFQCIECTACKPAQETAVNDIYPVQHIAPRRYSRRSPVGMVPVVQGR